jgi:D-alanyl-D-alanine carboxypeptidase (penicillin-binding protein 5/6)
VRYRALPAESQIELRPGEKMTVADLLRGLLIESANDAAATLATRIGGTEANFVRAMNKRAKELGLKNTHYANPIGLDDPANYSTARDLVRLTLRARAFNFFRRTVAHEQVTLHSGDHQRTLENRNGLVKLQQVNGVKTGHTQQAGYVLIASGRHNGITLISAVLGEPSVAAREADTRKLYAWAFRRYHRVRPISPNEVLARATIRYRRGAELELVAGDTRRRFVVRRGRHLRKCGLRVPDEVAGPIASGDKLGEVDVCRGKEKLATLPVVAAADVPAAGLGVRTKDRFTSPWILLLVLFVALAGTVGLNRLRRRSSNGRRGSRGEPEAA